MTSNKVLIWRQGDVSNPEVLRTVLRYILLEYTTLAQFYK